MAHIRQKRALRPVRRFRRLLRPPQLLFRADSPHELPDTHRHHRHGFQCVLSQWLGRKRPPPLPPLRRRSAAVAPRMPTLLLESARGNLPTLANSEVEFTPYPFPSSAIRAIAAVPASRNSRPSEFPALACNSITLLRSFRHQTPAKDTSRCRSKLATLKLNPSLKLSPPSTLHRSPRRMLPAARASPILRRRAAIRSPPFPGTIPSAPAPASPVAAAA